MNGSVSKVYLKCRVCHFWLFSLFLCVVVGCGGGGSPGLSEDTGGIAMRVVYDDGSFHQSAFNGMKLKCNAPEHGNVDAIFATIYDQNKNLVMKSDLWPCRIERGTISNVQTGSDYTVVLYGINATGEMTIRGEAQRISVSAGVSTIIDINVHSFVPAPVQMDEFQYSCEGPVGMSWNSMPDAENFEVTISDNNAMDNADVFTTADFQYTPSGLNTDLTYYWTVRAIDAYGYKSSSATPGIFSFGSSHYLKNILKDENNGSNPNDMIEVGGVLYFTAWDGSGSQLWKYDGSSVSQIRINASGSSNPQGLTAYEDQLYFRAVDGAGDSELWRYDGTQANKIDINGSGSSYPSDITVCQGSLYFSALVDRDAELYRYECGAQPEKINLNPTGSSNPQLLAAVNNLLYFNADDGSGSGSQLWRYNVSTGERMAIFPRAINQYQHDFAVVGNAFYFSGHDGIDRELWKDDGIAPPTKIDFCPGTCSGAPRDFTDINGTLYLSGFVGTERRLLKCVDTSVIDIDADNQWGISNPTDLTNLDGFLFFNTEWPTIGEEPSMYDGTEVTYLDDISIGSSSSRASGFKKIDNMIYFRAVDGFSDGTINYALWSYNLSTKGHCTKVDTCQGDCPVSIGDPAVATINDVPQLFFSGSDGITGNELWSMTDAGLEIMADINTSDISTIPPGALKAANGRLYFGADDGYNGVELWESDGSAAGTHIVADINEGTSGSYPKYITAFNGKIYFSAKKESTGYELWEYDGSAVNLIDINPGPAGSDPRYFAAGAGALYYVATNPAGRFLWKYDGEGDPEEVTDISYSNFSGLVTAGGIIYFTATRTIEDVDDTELFKYDGLTLTPININITGDGNPSELTVIDNNLYLSADNGQNGIKPYQYDGTYLTPLMAYNSGDAGSSPRDFTRLGDDIFFTAFDGTIRNIYRYSDGATMSIGLEMPSAGEPPMGVWSISDLFAADNALHIILGVENYSTNVVLWKSDGTASGTEMVKELDIPSEYFAGVSDFTSSNDKTYFMIRHYDGNHDTSYHQIWVSDGTEPNTQKLANGKDAWYDIISNGNYYGLEASYYYPGLEVFNGSLYYTHDDPQYGPEVWKHCP